MDWLSLCHPPGEVSISLSSVCPGKMLPYDSRRVNLRRRPCKSGREADKDNQPLTPCSVSGEKGESRERKKTDEIENRQNQVNVQSRLGFFFEKDLVNVLRAYLWRSSRP